jgi:hypothetical protein
MSIFVEDLLESAKDRTFAPVSQTTFQDSQLITIANDEMSLRLVSDMMSIREDFFQTSSDTSIRSGVSHYAVPKRAIGNALKCVQIVDSNGNVSSPLDRIDVDRAPDYQSGGRAFYFEGDEIVLVPEPTQSSGSIRMTYYARPNRLIATTSCAKITGISSVGGTTTLTVDTDLTASLSVGSKIDFLSSESPYMLWADRVVITQITASVIDVATSSIQDAGGTVEPQIDDYICPTGFANIPMVPVEWHPVLGQMMAIRILEAIGDLEKLNFAAAALKELRGCAQKLIKNRAESSPELLVRRNGLSSAFRR